MSSVQLHKAIPSDTVTVTDWYRQSVYDPKDNKVGDIVDVLVNESGKVEALIIGVGGFLGAGEKDVSVPFEADDLKNAPGFTYDRDKTTWVPENTSKQETKNESK